MSLFFSKIQFGLSLFSRTTRLALNHRFSVVSPTPFSTIAPSPSSYPHPIITKSSHVSSEKQSSMGDDPRRFIKVLIRLSSCISSSMHTGILMSVSESSVPVHELSHNSTDIKENVTHEGYTFESSIHNGKTLGQVFYFLGLFSSIPPVLNQSESVGTKTKGKFTVSNGSITIHGGVLTRIWSGISSYQECTIRLGVVSENGHVVANFPQRVLSNSFCAYQQRMIPPAREDSKNHSTKTHKIRVGMELPMMVPDKKEFMEPTPKDKLAGRMPKMKEENERRAFLARLPTKVSDAMSLGKLQRIFLSHVYTLGKYIAHGTINTSEQALLKILYFPLKNLYYLSYEDQVVGRIMVSGLFGLFWRFWLFCNSNGQHCPMDRKSGFRLREFGGGQLSHVE